MFNFHLSYKWLHWRAPASDRTLLPVLPEGIERFFVPTKGGSIEVLYAKPKAPSNFTNNATRQSPMFFVHGGMGCAAVWLEYMTYLSAKGVPCYALSMRGHGNSWHPSYIRMVYFTTKRMLANDVVAALRWAQDRESGEQVVLVGHSSGGGLSQFILSNQEVRVKGLVLAGAVPGFGSTGVYLNWWRLDPFFTIRMVLHGWHPNSPLSHPALTRRVFFSDKQTDEYVERFQREISNPYESFLWPLGMLYRFVDPRRILGQIGSGSAPSIRVMVLAGGCDRIMTLPVMEKLAAFYRRAWAGLASEKKLDAGEGDEEGEVEKGDRMVVPIPGEGGLDTAGQAVRLCVVSGAGHHLQNDVQWEVGAEKLLAFYEQL